MPDHLPSASVMIREPALRERLSSGGPWSGVSASVGDLAGEGLVRQGGQSQASRLQSRSGEDREQVMAGVRLLSPGRNLEFLAVAVIVLLSSGVFALLPSHIAERREFNPSLDDPSGLLRGFGLLMSLTVLYLVSKYIADTRRARRMIDSILEEEAVTSGLQGNPLTDYHHPEVCRIILMQQASQAARVHAPLTLLELHISGLNRITSSNANRIAMAELIRRIKSLCRATDSVMRWSSESFLLTFPEVSSSAVIPIRERLRQDLVLWAEKHFKAGTRPALGWRGAYSSGLESCEDILTEVHRLLENPAIANPVHSQSAIAC